MRSMVTAPCVRSRMSDSAWNLDAKVCWVDDAEEALHQSDDGRVQIAQLLHGTKFAQRGLDRGFLLGCQGLCPRQGQVDDGRQRVAVFEFFQVSKNVVQGQPLFSQFVVFAWFKIARESCCMAVRRSPAVCSITTIRRVRSSRTEDMFRFKADAVPRDVVDIWSSFGRGCGKKTTHFFLPAQTKASTGHTPCTSPHSSTPFALRTTRRHRTQPACRPALLPQRTKKVPRTSFWMP